NVPAKRSDEPLPSWQSAPPIRRSRGHAFPEPEPASAAAAQDAGSAAVSSEAYERAIAPSRSSRRALWVIGGMVMIAGFLIATITVLTLNAYVQTEARRYAQAARDYDDGKYDNAANAYQSLLDDYPRSENRSIYQWFLELSNMRKQVYAAQADPQEAFTAVDTFLNVHKSNPVLKTHKSDIW